MSIDKSGWVLVDFPRTINQAKQLEKALSGYNSLTDQRKPFERQNYEVWTKFADPDAGARSTIYNELKSKQREQMTRGWAVSGLLRND